VIPWSTVPSTSWASWAACLSISFGCGRVDYDPVVVGGECDGGACSPVCGSGGGSRDQGFGQTDTGLEPVVFGPADDFGWALAQGAQGKLLIGGRSYVTDHFEFAAARLDADGTPDPSFGTGGQSLVRVNHDFGYAIAVQPDGKILLGGDTWNFGRRDDWAYVRLEPTGALDATFGTAGQVLMDFGNAFDTGRAMAVQPDGKIVIVGTASYDTTGSDFAVVRLEPTGALDATFGSAGQTRTDFEGGADHSAYYHRGMSLLGDGRILVAGAATTGSGLLDFALVRYQSDGTLDPSFGIDGRVTTDFAGEADEAASMTVLTDGSILLAGFATVAGQKVPALARYDADGNLDPGFGTAGMLTLPMASEAAIVATATTATGETYAAGYLGSDGTRDLQVLRVCSDGSLDESFGNAGAVLEDLNGNDDMAFDLVLDPSGIVVLTQTNIDGLTRIALVRYTL